MGETTTPYGNQTLLDGASPRTFSAKAMSVISGGEFVQVSGAAATFNAVGSHLDTYAWDDIKVTPVFPVAGGTALFNGICLRNTASGGKATIATRGIILAMVGGSVLAGTKVECLGNTIQTVSSGIIPSALYATTDGGVKSIGRSLTPAYSGTSIGSTYALFDLQA